LRALRGTSRISDLAINGRRRQGRLRSLASGIDIPVRELYCFNTTLAAKGSQTGTFSPNFDV